MFEEINSFKNETQTEPEINLNLFNIEGTTLKSLTQEGKDYIGQHGTIAIPNSITSIGHSAFSGCSLLTSITLPNSITRIGDYSFSDCSGLTIIAIPSSVTRIGDYAFCECSGLTSSKRWNKYRHVNRPLI